MHESKKWKKSLSSVRDPMDCSPPGSSVHGIFQVRVLEWGATAFSGEKHLKWYQSGWLLMTLWETLWVPKHSLWPASNSFPNFFWIPSTPCFSSPSKQLHEIIPIIISILWLRKPRHREVKYSVITDSGKKPAKESCFWFLLCNLRQVNYLTTLTSVSSMVNGLLVPP